jgi:hypothetical protein
MYEKESIGIAAGSGLIGRYAGRLREQRRQYYE